MGPCFVELSGLAEENIFLFKLYLHDLGVVQHT